jgi:hypothetical protein
MMLHRLKRDVKTSMLSMSQLLATLSQRWSASPTTLCRCRAYYSVTHSLTYPITAAAAAITGQLGLRITRVHQSERAGHQLCQRWLNYIRIYHLFNLMMENNASCTIDIDLIISIHRKQHVKPPTIIIIIINCLSPSFIIIITRS